jgi:hypothetical protein
VRLTAHRAVVARSRGSGHRALKRQKSGDRQAKCVQAVGTATTKEEKLMTCLHVKAIKSKSSKNSGAGTQYCGSRSRNPTSRATSFSEASRQACSRLQGGPSCGAKMAFNLRSRFGDRLPHHPDPVPHYTGYLVRSPRVVRRQARTSGRPSSWRAAAVDRK